MALDIEFYLAWSDAPTAGVQPAFDASFARADETVLGFTLAQNEGEFATLTATIKGRGVSLLSAARKTWAWFSTKEGTAITPRFFGRLDGIQTVRSDDGPVMTLNFVAEPIDYDAQKETLADTLRVLPRYDEAFIDPASRDDDDLVLEGYPYRWHIDPVTHVVSVSDEIVGENGTLYFAETDMAYDGFSIDRASLPASSVSVTADLNWTQGATGTLDLSDYIVENWPGASDGYITSYTFQASNWPSIGASLGSGWTVSQASCRERYDLTVRNRPYNSSITINTSALDVNVANELGLETPPTTTTTVSGNDDTLQTTPPGSIAFRDVVTRTSTQVHFDDDGDVSSYSTSRNWGNGIIPLHYLQPTLIASYQAKRPTKETVTFTLTADLQPVIGGNASLDQIQLSSVDLAAPLDDSAAAPLTDARARSYLTTDRGQQSLQYMIARAQVALLTAARCVNVTFAPFFASMADVSLRKNATVTRPELPGGIATGKIIAYSWGMERNSGTLTRSVTIGCSVGHDGGVTASAGQPTYIDDDYIESDYQEYSGATVLFDSSVGYSPPLFDPADDGLDFIIGVSVDDVIDQPLTVDNPASDQAASIAIGLSAWQQPAGSVLATPLASPVTYGQPDDDPNETPGEKFISQRQQAIDDYLDTIRTVAHFRLKSMTASFATDYELSVTELKVPKTIDLEAA